MRGGRADRKADHVPGWRSWLGAALLAVGALALRWPQMTESVWYDEYCRTKAHLNAESLWRILGHDVHNPLYNAFMFGWTTVLGDSEVSIRVPSLVAGMSSLAALAVWAGGRFGREVGWSVAGLLAVSPVHVWYSGEAKNTMFVIATSVLALIAVDRLTRKPTSWSWLLAVLASTAAIWTDFVTALAVVPAFVIALVPHRGEPSFKGPWSARSAAAVVVVLIAPLVVFKALNIADVWRNYLQPMSAYEAVRVVNGKLLVGDTIFPGEVQRGYLSFALALPVGFMIVCGCRRLWRDRAGVPVVLAFALPIPLIWIVSEVIQAISPGPERYIYQPRNVVVMLCPLMLVLSAGFMNFSARWMRVVVLSFLVLFQAAGSVLMQTVYRDRATVMNPNPHWREIAAAIRETRLLTAGPTQALRTGLAANSVDVAAGEPMLISGSPMHPLRFYLGTGKVVWLKEFPGAELRVDEVMAEHPESLCFYIDDLNWSALQAAEIAEIEAHCEMRLIVSRGQVRVYSLTLRR